MQCKIASATLCGVEAVPVSVEVAVTPGIPGISIVGMGDTAVQEARERVRAAIRSSGFSMPIDKVVVNLAPGDLRKSGSGFDLPIAVGILVATGQLDGALSKDTLYVGELSLKGEVRASPGYLAFGMCARKTKARLVCGVQRTIPIEGLKQVTLRSLSDLRSSGDMQCMHDVAQSTSTEVPIDNQEDFRDIAGHETAKRALQIAAAGAHGILMSGPPGSGKTMLASRLPSIMPPLAEHERLETATIHSVAAQPIDSIVAGRRPFRNPHHSATMAGILGGGTPVRPGEVTLAHNGVLFLDELAEFKSSVLQGLRQPIETGEVVVTRAQGSIRMPASFMLVAATNPCPCGYFGDVVHECRCTQTQVSRYQARVGGPLIDRFHMQLDIHRLPSSDVLRSGSGTSSEKLRQGVITARAFSEWRHKRHIEKGLIEMGHVVSQENAAHCIKPMHARSTSKLLQECNLSDEAGAYLTSFADAEHLSGRAIVGLLKVARTIADIEERERVDVEHIAEAMGFRLSDTFGGA